MKSLALAKAIFAATLLIPSFGIASSTYSTIATRVGTNIYEANSGDIIITTRSCTASVSSSPSTLRIDANSGFVIGQITFASGVSCEVTGVYGYYANFPAGTFTATLTSLDYDYFLEQSQTQSIQRVFRTKSCNAAGLSFQSTSVSVPVGGRSYLGGVAIGELSWPYSYYNSCTLVGIYGWMSLAGTDLTVTKMGTGLGTVTSTPAGISCGTTCTWSFTTGSTVTLTATPSPESNFAGWGGACTGATNCTITMDAAKSVTATFSLASATTYSLTVLKSGTGFGTVASTPAGINCGSTCSANFTTGTSVTLTAAASTGSSFAGWSGGACAGTGSCTVTVSGPLNITASFVLNSGGTAPVLTNISTRGYVQTGNSVMIGGFVISGTSPKQVLITARGPSLAAFGVTGFLPNPKLDLYSGQTIIASNDDWGTNTNASAISSTGVAPTNPYESALLITLNPGAYTAIVSGVGGTTGIAIVEVFAQ